MTRARRTLRPAPWLALAVAVACGGPQKPGELGDTCFRTDDCQYGLVCVGTNGSSNRVCSGDVHAIVNTVPGPVAEVGGAPAAGAAGAPASGAAGDSAAGTSGYSGASAVGGTSATGGSSMGGTGGTGGSAGTGGTSGGGGIAPIAGAPASAGVGG